jgi:Zn-dependent oligopeptidase
MYGETGRSVVLPADMVGGVSATRAANLEASDEALKAFVDRVDAVLRDLESSAGNPTKVGAQTIKATSLSSGQRGVFPEATGLYTQYHRVHQELTALSKSLHLQIEAIGIAVQGARHGFNNLEEEQRRRFWEIQTQITEIQRATDGEQRTDNDGTLVM